MPHSRLLPLLVAVAATAPAPAQADPCDATAIVASIHDHYHAIVAEDADTRARAAARLFAILPELNGSALAHQMSGETVSVDGERMARIFGAATRLSRDLITGDNDTMVALAPHIANVDWLADRIADTTCFDRFAPRPKKTATATVGSSHGASKSDEDGRFRISLGVLLAILGVAAFGTLLWFFRKSRTYKIIRAERLPRHLTTIAVDIDFETPMRGPQSARITGLDVSLGGMKLAWQQAPPRGTELTLHLPPGERKALVVWSNAYYAGIVFEKQLDEDELKTLLG